MLRRLKLVLRRSSTQTVIHLYAIHFLNYLVPAATVAILARRLTPTCYGKLLIAQSLGFTVGTLTEFGFKWTGARAVAESGTDKSRIVSAIGAAKLVIAMLCIFFIPIYLKCIPSMSGQWPLIIAGYAWGAIGGNDLQWYFLGREKLTAYLRVDSAMRITGVAMILIIVKGDQNVHWVLSTQAICNLGLIIWSLHRISKDVRFVVPHLGDITRVIREGTPVFVQRLASYASTTANVAVLGTVASAAEVGYFGAAEKLVRYASSLAVPITQVVYPKMTRAGVQQNKEQSKSLAISAGTASVLLGLLPFLALFLVPENVLNLLYGAKMRPAVNALRILSVFPVLNSLTTSVLFYWFVPRRIERASMGVLLATGAFNVMSVALLGRAWKQSGAASAVVLTELMTLIGYSLLLRRHGKAQQIATSVESKRDAHSLEVQLAK